MPIWRAPVSWPVVRSVSETAATANSAPSHCIAWVTDREIVATRRWPVTLSPLEKAPLISIAPWATRPSIDARDLVDLRGGPHLLDEGGLVAPVERAVASDARDDLAVGVEAEEEERDAVALLEVPASQRALEARGRGRSPPPR